MTGLALHAFVVQIAVTVDAVFPAVPVLWAGLLAALALVAPRSVTSRSIGIAAAVFALMTPLRWLAPRWEPPVTLAWPAPLATGPVPGIVAAIDFWATGFGLLVLGLLAALVAALLTVLVRLVERPRWPASSLPFLMWIALVAAAIQCALLVQRSLTLPVPAAVIQGLPIIARAPALPAHPEGATKNEQIISAGALTIQRQTTGPNYVHISVQRGAHGDSRYGGPTQAFVVRHDARSRIMFLDDGMGPRAIGPGEPAMVVASHFDLLHSARPPSGWLLSALLGSGGALLLLLLGRWLKSWSRACFYGVVTATALSGLGPLTREGAVSSSHAADSPRQGPSGTMY